MANSLLTQSLMSLVFTEPYMIYFIQMRYKALNGGLFSFYFTHISILSFEDSVTLILLN